MEVQTFTRMEEAETVFTANVIFTLLLMFIYKALLKAEQLWTWVAPLGTVCNAHLLPYLIGLVPENNQLATS